MRTLITGASGFMGKHLSRRLKNEGGEVIGLSSRDCNLTVQGSLENLFSSIKFDQIYHLAAWTQAGDFCLYHKGEQWLTNQKINTNVLNWWKEEQPEAKIACIGTSCSYAPELSLKEENYRKGEPIESLETYAQTKRMMYMGLQAINHQFDLKYMHFISTTLYGPDYHSDDRQPHFIFDLMRKILRGKIHGEEVVLWGNGHQKRELVYIEDFVDLMVKLNTKLSNDSINIGVGKEYSIRDLAGRICDITGYDFRKIKFDETKYVGAKSKCLDITKLRNLIPNYKFKGLEDGLRETIAWVEKSPWVK